MERPDRGASRAWTRIALVALVASLFAGVCHAQEVCGDADGDGGVNEVDGVLTLRAAAGLATSCTLIRCDVDADGALTDADGILVLRKAAALAVPERCGRGSVAGTLIIPAGVASEAEPNDGAGRAQGVATLAVGSRARLSGAIAGEADAFDGFAFVATEPLALTLDLRFDTAPGIDLDLLVDDPTSDTALGCESAVAGLETCTVEVGAGGTPRRVDVVVHPAAHSRPAAYTLTVQAQRPGRMAPGLSAGAGAATPLDVSVAAYRGQEADFVPGELIAQLAVASAADAAQARESPAALAATVADVVQAAGMNGDWEPIAATPGGAVLFAVVGEQARTAHEAATTNADDALAAKRLRAALRARTRESVARLATTPQVTHAQPNYLARPARMPDDPLLAYQWHYALVGLKRAWDLTLGSANVIVATVDTGIRSDHPDLQGQLAPGYDFITSPQRANDGDGLDADPFDPGDEPGAALGGSYHGTHIAGTIAAATDNHLGVAGVGWRTRIMPLRALGVGGGTSFDIAEAIRFAAGLPNASDTLPDAAAQVINLSIEEPGDDPFMRTAVDQATAAGVLVVAAAGNSGSDAVISPAVFESCLAIAATDLLGRPAPYSSFGAAVDLAAPGGNALVDLNGDGYVDNVVSTLLPGAFDYAGYQGTSMAAAHVSGIAALMLARAGPASPAAVRAALTATAQDRGAPGRDDHYGFGLVDPTAAIRALAHLPVPKKPALALDTPTLDFSRSLSTLPVHAANAGGGVLAVTGVETTTSDGNPWLHAAFDTASSDVVVDVDRTELAAGAYSGQVDVRSTGGDLAVAIVMEVAPASPVDVGPVTVVLLDAETGATVASTTATFAQGYGYRFEGVRGGPYELFAGTDRDHDGLICDPGELCGAFPVRSRPATVTVVGGRLLGGRDFALDLVIDAGSEIQP